MTHLLKFIIPASIGVAGVSLYFYQNDMPSFEDTDQSGVLRPPGAGMEDPQPYLPPDIQEQYETAVSAGYFETIAGYIGFEWLYSQMPNFIRQADAEVSSWVDAIISGTGGALNDGAEWIADKGVEFFGAYFAEWFSPEMIMWIVFGIISFIAMYLTFAFL